MTESVTDKDVVVSFRVLEEDREAYDLAAEKAQMDRSEWIRAVLNAASGRSQLPVQMSRVVTYVAQSKRPKPIKDGEW